MVSTGISELDQRLGGLTESRYYLLTGTPGAGKTSACLHFIAEGLRCGEPCAILTQENPDDLLAQAEFIGHDFHTPASHDALVVLQYRLDFSANYARVGNPQAVSRELVSALGGIRPKRLVVDSILPFVQAGGVSHGAATALLQVMDELQCTAYFTVPGDLGDSFYARLYDPLVSGTAGLLHFEMVEGDVRQVAIRKIRQKPVSTDPLRFIIRGGLGIVEITDSSREPVEESAQRRVALVKCGGHLGGELFSSLERSYEVVPFATGDEAAAQINDQFGLVVVTIDPKETDPALAFIRTVRRVSGVPIVVVSEVEGLRSITRVRAQRAGADEFLTIDGSAQDLLNRVESARARGPRNTTDRLRRERLLVQPTDGKGRALPLPGHEIARAVRHHMATATHPFFALVRLIPPADSVDLAWTVLSRNLRLGDGDLIATADESGEMLLYLHDISRRHARELLERILAVDPQLESTGVTIDHFPADASRVEQWLAQHAPSEHEPAGV